MAGVKGRSGRRSRTEEERRWRVIAKAWEIIEQQLNNPDLSITTKLEIASKLVVKDIPTEVEGRLSAQVVLMPTILRGDQPLEYDIGESSIVGSDPPEAS